MNSTLRSLALSATLIAVPAAGFALAEMMISPTAQTTAATQSPGLGDLSAYKTIVADTQTIAATGDFAAAEHRITDLETLWDQNASALRQADRAACVGLIADGGCFGSALAPNETTGQSLGPQRSWAVTYTPWSHEYSTMLPSGSLSMQM